MQQNGDKFEAVIKDAYGASTKILVNIDVLLDTTRPSVSVEISPAHNFAEFEFLSDKDADLYYLVTPIKDAAGGDITFTPDDLVASGLKVLLSKNVPERNTAKQTFT